jgi:hypothetical protein
MAAAHALPEARYALDQLTAPEDEAAALRIETLATAYGRLYALPSDHAAIQAMLDVVADIAGALSVTDRWWQEAPVNSDVLPGS